VRAERLCASRDVQPEMRARDQLDVSARGHPTGGVRYRDRLASPAADSDGASRRTPRELSQARSINYF
jgi:hypothetical protein